jgi:hypothetical protein
MAEFNSCNWCGKIYRLKRGIFTGLVQNRKYCSKLCKNEAEGSIRFTFLKHPHKGITFFAKSKARLYESRRSKELSEIDS